MATEPAEPDFEEQLLASLEDPSLEAELYERYRRQAAVLVCDFTGMSQRTDGNGIIYALAHARRAEGVMLPAFEAQGGRAIKRVADTLFLVFETPAQALAAALDGQRGLNAYNHHRHGTPTDGSRTDPIHACIGLGCGEVLLIPASAANPADLYGAEVTRAFILGEELAQGAETLASADFMAALGAPPPGVGTFQAQEERAAEAGFAFVVVKDYREPEDLGG